ncbi:MAG: helix-turn-helix domain-containing protein [Micromonosporaceae bacterium]
MIERVRKQSKITALTGAALMHECRKPAASTWFNQPRCGRMSAPSYGDPAGGSQVPGKRTVLAAARRRAGFSQESLAEAVGVDRSTVVRWEAGETDPQPFTRSKLARALGLTASQLSELLSEAEAKALPMGSLAMNPEEQTTAEIETLPPLSAGDATDRRQALRILGTSALGAGVLATRTGNFFEQSALEAMEFTRRAEASQLGPRTLEHLELTVSDMAASFSRTPPHELFPEARWYRHQVQELIAGQHTLREGRELYRSAGWLSIVLAWLSNDLGDPRAAEAHCIDAWEHGWQAEDNIICAWAMDSRATINMYSNRPAAARDAAERGLAQAPPGSAAAVRVSAQLARAHAKLGHADQFEAVLRDTHVRLNQLEHHDSGLFSADSGRLASYAASSYIWLGQPQAAMPHAKEAITFYADVRPEERSPTREAISRLDLALAHAERGQPDNAAEEIENALGSERITGSVLSRLGDLGRVMQRRYPSLDTTTTVRERHEALLTRLNHPQLPSP